MLTQASSVLSFSNLVPTSHTCDITLDRAGLIFGIIQKMDMNLGYIISAQNSMIAQHDSSRLGFPEHPQGAVHYHAEPSGLGLAIHHEQDI